MRGGDLMDPNLFHVDWERTIEVLVAIIIMSFLVERSLALLFENRLYIKYANEKGLKEVIALGVGILVCVLWKFDAVSMIFLKEKVTWYGAAVTGAIVAGGSKASIRLFRDIMQIRSSSEDERLKAKKSSLKLGGTQK
jgi:hypothetical protein